ncbi:3-isopropylmalate dehydratase large subunit [Carex littledalei]|uniref:sulfiredoxin n=1 Tax=Carex littledalei TaxID=544730 RepID=A0A833RJU7_9POAL|nr:3-isopropylmalate dehydratase large subunit [Carex littledalei]
MEIPLEKIRRPLMRVRSNNPEKVKELMDSIRVIGLQVPIDVLEVDGVYYGEGKNVVTGMRHISNSAFQRSDARSDAVPKKH